MKYIFEHKKLGKGIHTQKFEINEDFFQKFDYSEISKAEIIIGANIDVKTTSISFHFKFNGFVNVQCDICLDYFNLKINSEQDLFVRFSDRSEFGEEFFEDDNKMTLNKSIEHIDLTKQFYDFIVLSLPIKKVHPLDENNQRTCNPDFLQKLEELETKKVTKDPRWEKLNNLLN